MELPHIGDTCEICERTDFLPFRCSYCNKLVCTEHRNNHGSDCPLKTLAGHPSNVDSNNKILEVNELLRYPCNYCKHLILELELVQCGSCEGKHCLAHRHKHNCSKEAELKNIGINNEEQIEKDKKRNGEILDRLRKEGSVGVETTTTKNKTVTPKNQQLAKRIRIMKIKQSAKGPPNVSLTNRLHFHVVYNSPLPDKMATPTIIQMVGQSGQQLNVYTSTQMSLGRLIDWIASQMGLTNRNNIVHAEQLVLKHAATQLLYDTQKTFGDLVGEGTIEDGDDIIIMYVKPGT